MRIVRDPTLRYQTPLRLPPLIGQRLSTGRRQGHNLLHPFKDIPPIMSASERSA